MRYKVDKNGTPANEAKDFITGRLKGGISSGRPADIVFDKGGRMFISDDKAGVIYKVIKK